MSKPRYKWWGYAKAIIRAYPEHCAELSARQEQSIIANYNPMSGHSSLPGRTVEALATVTLAPIDQRELDAVAKAISFTQTLKDGSERLNLISLVFFNKTHTLSGAAMQCNVSYQTAKRWHNAFIVNVAKNFGLL